METMKVVKKQQPGRGFQLSTAVIPEPGPDEILIKVKTVGICGTDLHIYKWDQWSEHRIKPPLIVGHEFVGEVFAVGNNVRNLFYKGQRVSAEGHITCGHCRYCRNGQGHICRDVKIIGVDRAGCFAEYICVPATNVWPVPDEIADKYAALFDPLGNAMHTVMVEPVAMKNILITGAGAIGLFAIPIAKANGAEKIIVIEPTPLKEEIAFQVGADLVLDPNDGQIVEKIRDFTDGGPDILLEMSGNPSAVRLGLELLSNGGSVSLLGIPSGDIPLNLAEEVIFKGITIHGITGRKMYETWYQCQSFLLKNAKAVDPIITHHFNLDLVEEGLKLMEGNLAGKVLLEVC